MELTLSTTQQSADEATSADALSNDVVRELSALELALIGGGTISGTYL